MPFLVQTLSSKTSRLTNVQPLNPSKDLATKNIATEFRVSSLTTFTTVAFNINNCRSFAANLSCHDENFGARKSNCFVLRLCCSARNM